MTDMLERLTHALLDAARKAEIMPYLERLRDEVKIPIVYVSHSVAEVMRLASDVAVLSLGRLAAFGPAAEIAQRLDHRGADAVDGQQFLPGTGRGTTGGGGGARGGVEEAVRPSPILRMVPLP